MADVAIFLVALGLAGVVGVGLGMLVARRLDAWVETRAAPAAPGPGSDPGVDRRDDGDDPRE
jgi:hypothetical protein